MESLLFCPVHWPETADGQTRPEVLVEPKVLDAGGPVKHMAVREEMLFADSVSMGALAVSAVWRSRWVAVALTARVAVARLIPV